MSKKGYSRPGLFGDIHHYDEKGHKIGTSRPGLFGGYTNYDEKGHKTGHSNPGLFGDYNHYDNKGHKTGSSRPGLFGSYSNYDEKGNRTGLSDPGFLGGYNHNDNTGCYVATAVYGSYDCPEVWTLRRYRDNALATTWYGRIFIRIYYSISPTLVKWFGNKKWFKNFWKTKLDKIVLNLQEQGYEDTPYRDRKLKDLYKS